MTLKKLFVTLALSAIVLLQGCASTASSNASNMASDRGGADPFEHMNRVTASFNAGLDKLLVKPLAQAYKFVTPPPLQMMVGNFFGNLSDLWTGTNNLLQGKPKAAVSDFTRFTLNTVWGLLGLVDVATDLGLEKHNEDFGQTLGVWGVSPGPYLVLPVLGPSSIRDAAGLIPDSFASPLRSIKHTNTRYSFLAMRAVDTRAGFLSAERFMDSASLDDYAFFRNGFFQRRFSQVYDGNPPEQAAPKYEDDDADQKKDEKKPSVKLIDAVVGSVVGSTVGPVLAPTADQGAGLAPDLLDHPFGKVVGEKHLTE
jgi:phospholipid-binding lipoprotein MlaA